MMPFLRDQVGALFCPWTVANAVALDAGDASFSVELRGETFAQDVVKYHAKSLAVLRQKYAAVADRKALDQVLAEAGCLDALGGAS